MNRSVKTAAVLVWCYAASLVYEAVGVGAAEGRLDKGHLVRHILGALVISLLGWALLQGRRWAWWAVVVVAGILGFFTVSMLIVFVLRPSALAEVEGAVRLGRVGGPLSIVSAAVLLGTVISLLKREAREAFFPRPR